MSLQLNESPVTYKEFFGHYHEQMPQLLRDGRKPMTTADIMRRRLEVAESDAQLRSAWLDNYFDTSDAVLYHPDGNIKIVRDAQPLVTINTQSDIRAGALVITSDAYRSLSGPEFARQDLITDTPLSKAEARASPIWQALAGDDHSLLNAYIDLAFSDAKRRFGYTENMGVYLGLAQATPTLRAWFVSRIGDGSVLRGVNDLDYLSARLIGVVPEAPARAAGQDPQP